MTAATRHIHGFRSYITSGALKFDFQSDTTLRFFGEGLNVRIRGTSNRRKCAESKDQPSPMCFCLVLSTFSPSKRKFCEFRHCECDCDEYITLLHDI